MWPMQIISFFPLLYEQLKPYGHPLCSYVNGNHAPLNAGASSAEKSFSYVYTSFISIGIFLANALSFYQKNSQSQEKSRFSGIFINQINILLSKKIRTQYVDININNLHKLLNRLLNKLYITLYFLYLSTFFVYNLFTTI